MKQIIISAVLALSALPAWAEDYEWYGHQHACVVETARSISIEADTYGNWGNAPKSFFLNLQECKAYAEANDLPYGVQYPIADPKISQKYAISRCVHADEDGRRLDYVASAKGLDLGIWPIVTGRVSFLTGDNRSIILQDDGRIDFSMHTVTDVDDVYAWFLLHANCTQLPD